MIKVIPKHTVFGGYITLGPQKTLTDKAGHRRRYYEVMCTCGKTVWVLANGLRNNKAGCRHCAIIKTTSNSVKHGRSNSNLYKIWTGIKQRCLNPKNKRFYRYSRLGITKRWEKSFECFLKDMGERPSKWHSIDRLDNSKGYSKKNCRWALAREQQNNTLHSKFIIFKKEKLTLKQWSEKIKINYDTLFARIKRGWSVEKALTTPVKSNTNSF